jgi:uncharacterized spore protein YtfJ
VQDLNQFTEQLENLISSKTVIGDPITVGEVTLLPIIRANFGFGMGSGNADGIKRGGASGGGGGAIITPVAIVVVKGREVDMLVIDKHESRGLAPLLEKLPLVLEKMPFLKKKTDDAPADEEEETEEQ